MAAAPAPRPIAGPNINPRNPHNPMPAVRALLVALDEWVVSGKEPPPSRVPTLADGTLVEADKTGFPAVPGAAVVKVTNQVAPPGDWVNPKPADKAYRTLVCKVDADGNEAAGIRLPDIAVPLATYSGWNEYKPPYPKGELADRDGSCLPFPADKTARQASGDPRPSIAERYASGADYVAKVQAVVAALAKDRLLLAEDAEQLSRASTPRTTRRAIGGEDMAKLDRDGVKIHYEVHGSGPTLLLSHGYSSTARMWDGQIAALKDRYQVDRLGHARARRIGLSGRPEPLFRGADRGRHEGAARPGRGQEGDHRRPVAGRLHVARLQRQPSRARARADAVRHRPGLQEGRGARQVERDGAPARRRLSRPRDSAALNSSDEVKLTRHRDASGLAGAARGMLAQENDRVIQSLDKVAVPTLVLVGANDTNFLAATDYMAAKIKQAIKVVVADAGHAANLHQPALFNQAVEAFLARLPAA